MANSKKTKNVHQYLGQDKVVSPCRLKSKAIGVIKYENKSQEILPKYRNGELELRLPSFNEDALVLPSGEGSVVSAGDLYRQIKQLISQVACLPDEGSLIYCSAYVLSTWLYDQYLDIGYLALVGPPGGGKSTLLQAISALSYNSMLFSGAASNSAIFRSIDAIRGTLCLEEAQRSACDYGSEFHKMLAVGNNKSGNVPRVSQKGSTLDFTTELFSVFGPKILCGRAIPGDDAILSRTFGINMKPVSLKKIKELSLVPVNDVLWLRSAEVLRNNLLLYRQMRLLNELTAPNLEGLLKDKIDQLSPREYQVCHWVLNEFPDRTDLEKLFKAIIENKNRIRRRKEEFLEPTVLYVIYGLLKENSKRHLYLKTVSNNLLVNYGVTVNPKRISSICEQNGIDRYRANNGHYILASPDFVADKLVVLGYSDPRDNTFSSPASPENQKNEF